MQVEAARELLRRRRALDSMMEFGAFMRSTGELDFKFKPVLHHILLIHALEGLLDPETDYTKLMIMMPPGGAKSTYCSIQFALWYMAKFPHHNILCASNTETLAENFNRRRRNTSMTKEFKLVSGTSLSKDQQGVGKFSYEAGGSVTAAGVGSGILGVRSNLNILDDPILNFEQSNSTNILDKQWDWYQADFRSRLIPSGLELIVTTRFAKRDIPGRILDLIKQGEETGWKVLRLPMECDNYDDPLGRELGDRIWPEWFTEEQVRVNKRDTQRWMGMYQQIPMDESGVWVGPENIQIVETLPSKLTIVAGVDIALTVGGGDYTVFVVAGIDDKRNLYVLDVVREQVDVDTTCETFFRLMETYDITYFYIDDDNSSKMLERLLIEKCKARGQVIPLHVMPLRGQDKEIRAAPLRGWFMQKRVFILKNIDWNNALVAELMDFPAVDHDDQVDAFSLIGRQYSSIPTPTVEQPLEERMKFFLQEKDGQLMTSVPLDTLFEENEQRSGVLSLTRGRI